LVDLAKLGWGYSLTDKSKDEEDHTNSNEDHDDDDNNNSKDKDTISLIPRMMWYLVRLSWSSITWPI
jgi:hypothetical protein